MAVMSLYFKKMNTISPKLSYARLGLLFVSWFFVMDSPEIFLMLFIANHCIYMVQQLFCDHALLDKSQQQRGAEARTEYESELSKQLRILMTRLQTSILLFAIIRNALDHSHHKNQPNTKTGIPEYDAKVYDLDNGTRSNIDQRTQDYCFALTCLFFLDFIAAWFDQYSKYFAGLRFEIVSNILERVIQQTYDFKVVFILVGAFSEAFLVGQYMK